MYWFDDTGQGECRIPRGWRVLYKRGEAWVPVATADAVRHGEGPLQHGAFTPGADDGAFALEVQLPEEFSAGIQEWKVR